MTVLKRWDKVLFFVLLTAGLLGVWLVGGSVIGGEEVVVRIDETVVRRLPLDGSGLHTFESWSILL